MSMGETKKIYARDDSNLALKVTKGHFASDRFHVNYYIDMTTLKMREDNAIRVAKAMVKRYIKKVELPVGTFGVSAEAVNEFAGSVASVKPVDTIVCMDGCEVIGAYLAREFSDTQIATTNAHKTLYIITPEFDHGGQMVVRDNIKPMIKDKHVLVVLATAMSGRTISKSIRCIESYGGIVEGVSVIFGAVDHIDSHPVHSVFDMSDIPDFQLSEPDNCTDCKDGKKIDAIVNSYGYSVID
ncbi:MAG: orotate phosphoribosyltransferase [Lachnospiraceae bacterium]|nr:orotate phosphoribosyltransferase [Lachnospiraceae bacterium]